DAWRLFDVRWNMMVSSSSEVCAYTPAAWGARVRTSRCSERREDTGAEPPPPAPTEGEPWRAVHHQLIGSAKRQCELDAEQLELLREAERLEIWRPLGMVSMLDYMERVLGHNPETARKRLRVARALGTLPKLSAALRDGTLSFSAVK